MNSNSRKIIMAVLIIILGLIIAQIRLNIYKKINNNQKNIYLNWDISLDTPDNVVDIFISEPSFHGDGERYAYLEYSKEDLNKVKNLKEWIIINKDNIKSLNKKIEKFKEQAFEMNKSNIKSYEENPINLEIGDKYIYKKDSDGSYIILILKGKENRVYLQEWKI
ncbi:hypothetical protein [Faecalimicrobium dakarense]|uniref:hypothetical protein n=1 Tax=Faecalimicrobium dakarense TaxID=1301100 RepID=UPI0004B5796B|nr:hypothetical protein [[Clostridium] dakarense]